VGVGAWIGSNAIVNTAASIDHDGRVGAHASIAPGVHLAGRVSLGEGAFVGIGAAVREGVTIGEWAFVAGGAMVVRDVPADTRVAGVPARKMGE
jgi:acetyltransferase-like isoleucine patch superfamily enzyme